MTGWSTTPLVYRDSVLVTGAGYARSSSGLVTFTAAPGADAVLTFTASGEKVLRVVCERWTSVVKGFNGYDVSAEFEEVAG